MKHIWIISSNYTGHGHASISKALEEQLEGMPDVTVRVVEGFRFIGRIGVQASKMYGPITRGASDLWKLTWDVSTQLPDSTVEALSILMHNRFIDELRDDPPNLILSVHPVFNKPLMSLLKYYNLKIPFVTLLADLVDIHPFWIDGDATRILCPTEESVNVSLSLGAAPSNIVRCGFPVRRRFTDPARTFTRQPYTPDRPLEALIMSGGEGSGNLYAIARQLLRNFDVHVTIVCGNNKQMRATLQRRLQDDDRVRVLGFVTDVQDLMMHSDIAFLRGSPNTMMEAVTCNLPFVITGALPGQEQSNPNFAQMHGLGVVLGDLSRLTPLLRGLLAEDATELKRITQQQRAFVKLDAAKEIADMLVDWADDSGYLVPSEQVRTAAMNSAVRRLEKMNRFVHLRHRGVRRRLRAYRRSMKSAGER